MASWNPHANGTVGLEYFPNSSGVLVLDSGLKAAAFSMDQSVSQVIANIGIPVSSIPARGGMYAVEVYDGDAGIPLNLVTQYAVPNEDVLIGSWRNQAASGVNLFQSIDEPFGSYNSADYIAMSGQTSRYTGRFNTATFATLTGKRILAVTLTVVAGTGPTGAQKFGLNIASTDYDALFQFGATPAREMRKTWTANPSTGREWTITDITNFDTVDEWYVEGATDAAVYSANQLFDVLLRVTYVDENRIAVGYLDDRASALVTPDAWNLAPTFTPIGGAWTKDAVGRHLYVIRRISDKGALAVPYLDAGAVPPIGQGWDVVLDSTYGYVTVQTPSTKTIGVLQRTSAPADSVDSQSYVKPVAALVYTGRTAEQEASNTASGAYGILRFLANPISAKADLLVKVKRRSDNVQLGGTATLTVAVAQAQAPLNAAGWRVFQMQLASTAALVAGTQYFVEFSSTTDLTHPWFVQAVDTLNSGNSATYQGATDRAVVNGVEADRYDLAATLATTPAAPASITVTVAQDLVGTVTTGSICCDVNADLIHIVWAATAHGGNFARYELERNDGAGAWSRIANITSEAVVAFDDREARRGVFVLYRIRVIRTDGSFSDWRLQSGSGVKTTSSNPSLWLTSNLGQESSAYDYQPAKSYDFSEDGERSSAGAYMRDFSLGYNPKEWRGTTAHFRLILAVDDRVGPVGQFTNTGADVFYQLRRVALAEWPYVCVLDHRGNRYFAFLRVPSGSEDQPAARYLADLAVVEVAASADPYVVTVSTGGEVGV